MVKKVAVITIINSDPYLFAVYETRSRRGRKRFSCGVAKKNPKDTDPKIMEGIEVATRRALLAANADLELVQAERQEELEEAKFIAPIYVAARKSQEVKTAMPERDKTPEGGKTYYSKKYHYGLYSRDEEPSFHIPKSDTTCSHCGK